MIDFKKLLLFLIIAVVIAAAGLGLYWQKQWQKTHIPSDISSAAVQAKCLEDVSKMNEEQIIEKINTLPFATGEELTNINKKAADYFFCNFNNSDKSEGIYEEIKSLIEKLAIKPEMKDLIIKNLTDNYSLAKKDDFVTFVNSLPYMLAIADLAEICPNKLPDVCLKEFADYNKSYNIIVDDISKDELIDLCKNKICNFISQYPKNKDEVEREVINFQKWSKDLWIVERQYRWRIALAYRFGGKELSLKVCNNLDNINKRNNCISTVDSLESNIEQFEQYRKKKEECINLHKNLENLICQSRGQ